MTTQRHLDLDGCAALLGQPRRVLAKLVRRGEFTAPAEDRDGVAVWREGDVFTWAAVHVPGGAAAAPLRWWPDASEPVEFRGAIRRPHRYGLDSAVLVWQHPCGLIGMLWRTSDSAERLTSWFDYLARGDTRGTGREIGGVDLTVLVRVDGDFGPWGPGLTALNVAHREVNNIHDVVYSVGWAQLARLLGQPIPFWPYVLRDPDLIAAWRPGAATVTAPADPDLDTSTMLRMAAMFDTGHATARTLTTLARVAQDRATRSALDDLRILAECAERARGRGYEATTTVAAQPLVIGDLDADVDDIDPTTRRIGWMELLNRTDTLSFACVRQALMWDGGQHFPFAQPAEVDPTTSAGEEWVARLEPTRERTAAFAAIDDDGEGDLLTDPLTDAPAVRKDSGRVVTAVPQRLPASSALAEVILEDPIWVRTTDGSLYPAPKDHYFGLSWGYGGSGPGSLALLIHRLLDDIAAPAADHISGAAPGLEKLTEIDWPSGTVLDRELLLAARDDRPWNHPDKPAS